MTILLFLGITLAMSLHATLQAAAALVYRIPIERIGLNIGPRLWRWTWCGIWYELNLLPFGSYVAMDAAVYNSRSVAIRITTNLVAPVGMLALGCLLSHADPLRIGLDVLRGLLHPIGRGAALLHVYRDHFQTSVAYPFGCLLIAVSLINLLPLTVCGGGQALFTLLRVPARPTAVLEWVSLVVIAALLGSALVAFGCA